MSGKHRRVLLVQLKRVGDVLLCTPLIRALRADPAVQRIVFLTEEHNRAVLERNTALNEVLTVPAKMSLGDWLNIQARLRHQALDCVFDLSGTPRSCTLTALSCAPLRVGFRVRAPRRWVYNRTVIPDRSKYTVDRRLDLLREFGIGDRGFESELYLGTEDRREARALLEYAGFQAGGRLLAVAPTSRKKVKRWSADGFARVASWARDELGMEILLLSGYGEEEQAEEVRGAIPGGARRLPQVPPLQVLAALIEGSHVLVANDGGPKHLGVAVGTPTVTLFVSTAASSWHPPNDPRHIAVQARGDLDAEVEEVTRRLRSLLEEPD